MNDEITSSRSETSTSPPSRAEWIISVCALALLLISYLCFVVPPPIANDDAFITFRYAENIAAGHGFVYNEGERVLGTSTPLYSLILAAGRIVGLPIRWFASALEALAVLAIGALYLLLFRRLGHLWAGVLAIAILGFVDRNSLSMGVGMESPLYGAGIIGVCVALQHRRAALAVLIAGCVTLLRPEGFLIAMPLAVGLALERRAWWPSRSRVFLALGIAALMVAAWTGFAALYFGSPIPHSVSAKALHTAHGTTARFRDVVPRGLIWLPGDLSPRALLFWIGIAFASIRWRATWPVWLWFISYVAVFSATPAPFYAWYTFPMTVCLVASLAFAAILAQSLLARIMHPAAAVAIACALLIAALNLELRISMHSARNPWGGLSAYEKIGPWLRDNTPAEATVASWEIGILGHFSERRIVDLHGLITPQALLPDRAESPEEIVRRLQPDFVVFPFPGGDPRAVLAEEFFDQYRPVHQEAYSFGDARSALTVVFQRIDP